VAVYGSALSAAQVNTHYTRATDGGLTLSTGSQYAYVSSWPRDLYYNSAQSGSFTVTGNIADAESGMQKINFPTVSTMTGGGDDTTSPYSATYNWTSASTATQAQYATAYNNLGDTSTAYFWLYRDITAPSAFSLTAPSAGYVNGAALSVSASPTDPNPGITGQGPSGIKQ